MDADIREAFATLSAQGADVLREARGAREEATEARREIRHLNLRVDKLEKEVFGSDPPAAPTKPIPLVARTSEAEADVDAIQGQLIAVEARLGKVETLNVGQSKAMGIAPPTEDGEAPGVGARVIAFATSRAGGDLLVKLLIVLLAALGYRSASSVENKVEHSPPPVVAPGATP